MASLNRTFSFGDHDEESLDPTRRYAGATTSLPPPLYTDSPTRQNDRPPPPPEHRSNASSSYQLPPINTNADASRDLNHSLSHRTTSTVTPGADNLGEDAAGGGLGGIALGIANTHARDSGMEALRSVESLDRNATGLPAERGYETTDTPYIPAPPNTMSYRRDPFVSPAPSRRSDPFDDNRRLSMAPSPGQIAPRAMGHQSLDNIPMSEYPAQGAYADSRNSSYLDNPYNRYSTAWDTRVAQGDIDPNQLDDGDDDGMPPHVHRASPAGAAHGSAGAGGIMGALGGLVGKKNTIRHESRDTSGYYGPVGGPVPNDGGIEKSDWLNRQTAGRKRLRWVVGILVALAAVGAIVGGVVGAMHHNSSSTIISPSTSQGKSAAEDDGSGDLDKDSAEIKKLMGNSNLHKVFPGMDYTPFNAQYPACLTNPPSQNNVTRDMAVLSQLTNTVRLYGTDCNQTDMVIHSMNKLGLTDMKIWLGVWLDKNATTSNRGISAMYDILSRNGQEPFAGVIVGNEVLYRQDMTESQLADILSDVKKNFTSLKYTLPVATSDLGDDWTADLATGVDVIMSSKWTPKLHVSPESI